MSILIDTPVYATIERWQQFLAEMKELKSLAPVRDHKQINQAIATAEYEIARKEKAA